MTNRTAVQGRLTDFTMTSKAVKMSVYVNFFGLCSYVSVVIRICVNSCSSSGVSICKYVCTYSEDGVADTGIEVNFLFEISNETREF